MRVRVTSCARPSRSISALHLSWALLLLAAADTESKSVATSHGLQAFGDFLQWQQLRHAIITYNADARRQLLRSEQLQPLVRQYRIRFFGVSATPVRSFGANFYYSAPRVGVYLPELADVQLQRHVLQAGAADIFNNSQAWLLLTNECSASAVWENANRVLGALNISVSADITLAVKAKNDSLLLYDVYKACQNSDSQLEIEEKGLWSPENGFTVKPKFRHGFISRRKNLCNITLRAGTAIHEKPANMSFMEHLSNSKDNLQLDPMQRKTYHLLKMLEPMFNVSFEVLFSDNWGSYINGSWNGVIARLLAHEVEFSICPMRFTPERIHLIQYTPELHTEFILFLFRHPRRNAIRNIFFEPFVNEVWFSVMALVVLVVLLLAVHVQHEFRRRQRQRQRQHQEVPATEPPLERRFDFVVLLILEAIFMQGPSPSMFGASSTRILILFTGVFSVMLLQFYSAFIVGSLLADAPRSITTLAALYNSSLEIGMENVSYNYEIFTNTTNPVAHEIYSRRICKNARSHILAMEQGAQRMGEGGFAFHVSVNRMYRILKANLTESEFCDLQEILLNPPYTASATLRKNSPYREHFAQAILHLRATGLMQYNDRQWEVQKTDCSLNQNREVEVDLEHFIPALMFLASAMVTSVTVLLLELCYSRLKRNWQQADGNANNLSEVNIKFQH